MERVQEEKKDEDLELKQVDSKGDVDVKATIKLFDARIGTDPLPTPIDTMTVKQGKEEEAKEEAPVPRAMISSRAREAISVAEAKTLEAKRALEALGKRSSERDARRKAEYLAASKAAMVERNRVEALKREKEIKRPDKTSKKKNKKSSKKEKNKRSESSKRTEQGRASEAVPVDMMVVAATIEKAASPSPAQVEPTTMEDGTKTVDVSGIFSSESKEGLQVPVPAKNEEDAAKVEMMKNFEAKLAVESLAAKNLAERAIAERELAKRSMEDKVVAETLAATAALDKKRAEEKAEKAAKEVLKLRKQLDEFVKQKEAESHATRVALEELERKRANEAMEAKNSISEMEKRQAEKSKQVKKILEEKLKAEMLVEKVRIAQQKAEALVEEKTAEVEKAKSALEDLEATLANETKKAAETLKLKEEEMRKKALEEKEHFEAKEAVELKELRILQEAKQAAEKLAADAIAEKMTAQAVAAAKEEEAVQAKKALEALEVKQASVKDDAMRSVEEFESMKLAAAEELRKALEEKKSVEHLISEALASQRAAETIADERAKEAAEANAALKVLMEEREAEKQQKAEERDKERELLAEMEVKSKIHTSKATTGADRPTHADQQSGRTRVPRFSGDHEVKRKAEKLEALIAERELEAKKVAEEQEAKREAERIALQRRIELQELQHAQHEKQARERASHQAEAQISTNAVELERSNDDCQNDVPDETKADGLASSAEQTPVDDDQPIQNAGEEQKLPKERFPESSVNTHFAKTEELPLAAEKDSTESFFCLSISGPGASLDVSSFLDVFLPLSYAESGSAREIEWPVADTNGEGALSLATIERWIQKRLCSILGQKDGMLLFKKYFPAYSIAFHATRDIPGTLSPDFVNKAEFRQFIVYLCVYALACDAFYAIDRPFGNSTGRLTRKEWLEGYKKVAKHGFYSLLHIVELCSTDSTLSKMFDQMDNDKGGTIHLKEWCNYLKNAEIDARSVVGRFLLDASKTESNRHPNSDRTKANTTSTASKVASTTGKSSSIKHPLAGTSASSDVKKFLDVFLPLTFATEEARVSRKNQWELAETRESVLSLKGFERWVQRTLYSSMSKEEARAIFLTFSSASILAFQATQTERNIPSDEGIRLSEFRLVLSHTCVWALASDAFDTVRGEKAVCEDVSSYPRMSRVEWLKGFRAVEEHGFLVLSRTAKGQQSTRDVFNAMDCGSTGMIELNTWCKYMIDEEKSSKSTLGSLVTGAHDELDEEEEEEEVDHALDLDHDGEFGLVLPSDWARYQRNVEAQRRKDASADEKDGSKQSREIEKSDTAEHEASCCWCTFSI